MFLIHGHIHNKYLEEYRFLFRHHNALNAGVDINGFMPVTFDELVANNEKFMLSCLTNKVDKALLLCNKYHAGQLDKAGKTYAKHPIYVSSNFEDDERKIVALLLDTLEDTNINPDLIREQFGDVIFESVFTLTHREDENYFTYINRIKGNPLAASVKIADLRHNMDLSRLKTVTDKDLL